MPTPTRSRLFQTLRAFLCRPQIPHGVHSAPCRPPHHRRPRLEPLEDRRMLSVTLFVNDDAQSGGDGVSWSGAYADLQAALDEASVRNGDAVGENDVEAIWIAEGVYTPTAELQPGQPRSAAFSLVDGVSVYGGFAGTEGTLEEREADATVHETILSGDLGTPDDTTDNAYMVVYCGVGAEAKLEGLTITGANTGGVSGSRYSEYGGGGGIFNDGGILTIDRTYIRDNHILEEGFDGGGIYSHEGTLLVTNSVVSHNSGRWGGGIRIVVGTASIVNSIFSANSADYGGGMASVRADVSVFGTLFVENSAIFGSGLYDKRSTVSVTASTFVENDASWDGVLHCDSQEFTVSGSIFWDNGEVDICASAAFVAWNNLFGVDPRFVDPDIGDYRLSEESPAIDSGSDSSETQTFPDTDLAGNARLVGNAVDLGDYEFQGVTSVEREFPSTVVTTTNDSFDPYDGQISLREALFYAAPSDTTEITFDTSCNNGTIRLAGTSLFITSDVTIDAASCGPLEVIADGESRVFTIFSSRMSESTLRGLAISGGCAQRGGGVFFAEGTLRIVDSTVSNNHAGGNGGGVYNENGVLSSTDCAFRENTADYLGGGLCSPDGEITLTRCKVVANSADYGAGLYCGTLTAVNSLIANNRHDPYHYGGGIYASSGHVSVTNCTIVDNGFRSGDGIYATDASLAVSNTIFWDNGVDDIYVEEAPRIENCLSGIDPLFQDPDAGDYRLTASSPAIDVGENRFADGSLGDEGFPAIETDFDGNGRIYGRSVDMGAHEYRGELPPDRETPSTVVTTSTTVCDTRDGLISLPEAILYASAARSNEVTFDVAISGATITLNGSPLVLDRSITVDASALDALTIDAGGESSVFVLYDGIDRNVVLRGLAITGGAAANGGGILTYSGRLAVQDSILLRNVASQNGGGIHVVSGTVTVADSRILGNTSVSGGGLSVGDGECTVTNSAIFANLCSDRGAGIYNSADGKLAVVNSTIVGNSGPYAGIGIYSRYSHTDTVTLNNTIVAANTTTDSGKTDVYFRSSNTSGTHNLIGRMDDSGVFVDGESGNLVGTPDDPIDPRFARLPDPGPDETWGTEDDDYGDLRLMFDLPRR